MQHVTMPIVLSLGTFYGGRYNGWKESEDQEDHRSQLRREFGRNPVLPLPANGGFRRFRLGLDHRSEEIRS